MYVIRIIILFIAFWVSVSCQTLCNTIEIPIEIVDFSSITKDSLITLCNSSINRNKSIGVFGGSYSIMEESHIVKDGWRHYLNNNVTDYVKSGYGFSSDQGSIQDEFDSCDIKDIYVLWASTNDFNFNREAGSPTDYTSNDNYNERNRVTQCGGINYCIKTLREQSSNSLIVMISSSVFYQSEKGHDMALTNATGNNLAHYVKMQSDCCRLNKVPFLNLLDSICLEESDFQVDMLHYNETGYQKMLIPATLLIACPQWFL